jgi:hypothetical protein
MFFHVYFAAISLLHPTEHKISRAANCNTIALLLCIVRPPYDDDDKDDRDRYSEDDPQSQRSSEAGEKGNGTKSFMASPDSQDHGNKTTAAPREKSADDEVSHLIVPQPNESVEKARLGLFPDSQVLDCIDRGFPTNAFSYRFNTVPLTGRREAGSRVERLVRPCLHIEKHKDQSGAESFFGTTSRAPSPAS